MEKKRNMSYFLGVPRMGMKLRHDVPYGEQERNMHERVKKIDDSWEKWKGERAKKKRMG